MTMAVFGFVCALIELLKVRLKIDKGDSQGMGKDHGKRTMTYFIMFLSCEDLEVLGHAL